MKSCDRNNSSTDKKFQELKNDFKRKKL